MNGIHTTPSPISLRMATQADADAFLAVYGPYVENTAISFEYQVPTREEFARRIGGTLKRYPYLAALQEGQVVGYAYASPFNRRSAYSWSAEVSIYVAGDARGSGIGARLYHALESILKKQNVLNVNACIAYPNPGSISFHEKLGYKKAGHFTKCGYKLGRWWDMVWMEKMLGEHPEKPEDFIPVTELGQKDLRDL
ncbi:MAG: N-acetyltransferase family protein [Clostridium sp.]|nr:N-acetyltransferase family protein [Clostridium sp.]